MPDQKLMLGAILRFHEPARRRDEALRSRDCLCKRRGQSEHLQVSGLGAEVTHDVRLAALDGVSPHRSLGFRCTGP